MAVACYGARMLPIKHPTHPAVWRAQRGESPSDLWAIFFRWALLGFLLAWALDALRLLGR